MNYDAPPEAGHAIIPMQPLISRKAAALLGLILVLPFALALSGRDIAEKLACAAYFSALVFGFIAIIYVFRVIKRRSGFVLTLLAVHENGLLLRSDGKTVLAHWSNIANLSHVTVVYKGAPLVRHTVQFRNGVNLTYGGDLWSERECQSITAAIERKLGLVAG